MEEFDIKQRNLFSIGPHLLGVLFIAVGIFTMVSPLIITSNNSASKALMVGSAALFFGLIVITSYGGTLFDFKTKRYKNYYSFLGYKFGQWENLPSLKLIRVFSNTHKASRSFDGVHPSTSGNVTSYKAAIYSENPKPVLVFENTNMSNTLKVAKILSDNLDVMLDIQLSEVNGGFELKI